MNPRVATAGVGALMLLLGLAGLFYPDRVMGMLGFAVMNPSSAAAVLGEMRATYGGLFVVAGAWVLWAAMDPAANRGLILFVGLLWLGASGGRLFGIFVDGNPGILGWLSVVFELLVGGTMVLAARLAAAAAPSSPSV